MNRDRERRKKRETLKEITEYNKNNTNSLCVEIIQNIETDMRGV